MKVNTSALVFLFFFQVFFAQEQPLKEEEIKINKFVNGTLLTPPAEKNPALVILIQGSGLTDRNGNQPFMKNDSFKKLAQQLAENGIASFRYDKRIMEMGRLGITEEDLRFDHFITDAVSVLDYFKTTQEFRKLVVLGHSQGSLTGMVAAKGRADGFISIAGVAQSIDSVIITQMKNNMPELKEKAESAYKEMREKGSTSIKENDPTLFSLFRPGVQPFMLSWMQYNPLLEITKLKMPILIINGTKDLQIEETDGCKLAKQNPDAELVLLENMNHVLREIEGDSLENSKTYNEPNRPLHPQLVSAITKFISNL